MKLLVFVGPFPLLASRAPQDENTCFKEGGADDPVLDPS